MHNAGGLNKVEFERFGELHIHPAFPRLVEGHPEVMEIYADENSTYIAGEEWHSDVSCDARPPLGSLLYMLEVPADGGDTLFANMYAAFEGLSTERQAEIRDLKVVHSWRLSRENEGREMSAEELADAPDNTHPLARIHPETSRAAIFAGMHASHIEGWPFEKGRALILELEAHATQPQFLYRHTWRPGDMLMWDNRCLLHRAEANFDAAKYPRVLHRTCLRGTPTS